MQIRKHFALIGMALLTMTWGTPFAAQAIPIQPGTGAEVATGLTVHGHADFKVRPDIAHLTVGVTTQERQPQEAAQKNAAITTAVLNALRSAGIADKDIQTSGYDTQPQYDSNANPPVLTGYQVSNTVDVTIRTLGDAGAIIDKVTQAGATNVSDLSFDLTNRTAAEQQALAQAVTEAQAKADAMAQAAGIQRGPLLSLSEGAPVVVQPFIMARSMMAAAAPEPTTPVEGNEITVSADVTAVYALGQ